MLRNMIMAIVGVVCSVLLVIGCLYIYYFAKWKHLWALDARQPVYEVSTDRDNALRVLLIGDSWAGMHTERGMDSYLQQQLAALTGDRVEVRSKGKGGEKTKGIYRLMFQTEGYGTKPLLMEGADYCVVFAGINDAAANLGVRQYCYYYRLILDFLLTNHIRPVVVEIPDVNIWRVYGSKPLKDHLSDYVKSRMTNCRMYNFQEYREGLYEMLKEEHLMEKVIYVRMDLWNKKSPAIDRALFLDDEIHLNREGYERLDACIARAIAEIWILGHSFSYAVYQPVDGDA